ncbi:MAG TPA: OmpA family protein, partial [Spirochaetota bacterium]|nr:OmpA family protein [Spirochaetota bacterium]
TIRNLFVGLGVGFRVPLGADVLLVPGLSAGLGFDRRQEIGNPATDHNGFVALASLALEYRIGENLGLSVTAFPFLVNNDGFRTISNGVTFGINWRFSRSRSLANEVRESGLVHESLKDDSGRMRIDLPDVSFDPGSSRLTAETRVALEGLAIRLSRYSVRGVVVAGHTDDTGRAVDNQALSILRAEAVARVLAAGGIEKGKIKASGHGSTRPRYPNDNETNRRRNRRVEITITE